MKRMERYPEGFDSWKQYDRVKFIAEAILRDEKCTSEKKTLSGLQIWDKCEEHYPDSGIPQNSLRTILSQCVKNTDSQIYSPGPKRGYYLSAIAGTVNQLEQSQDFDGEPDEATRTRIEKEKLLYPCMVDWLQDQGYRSSDTSRGRQLGKWGNPDVTGILSIDNCQTTSIEIVTIEIKPSISGWEQWIFEAVSHRRFANRAYFAFANPQETIGKTPPSMRYYAELFNIGVLVIGLEKKTYLDLINGRLEKLIQADETDVREIYSAPYSYVQPKWQKHYCEGIGIRGIQDLFNWGSGPE